MQSELFLLFVNLAGHTQRMMLHVYENRAPRHKERKGQEWGHIGQMRQHVTNQIRHVLYRFLVEKSGGLLAARM